MSAFERLTAAFAIESLLALRLPRRPRRLRPATATPFTAHVLPQWPVTREVHGLQYASHLEPACGCTSAGGA